MARALGAVALALLLAGCDGPGVLYTLATEFPRTNSNLPDELSVTAVVSSDRHYYVSAGGMWRRAHGVGIWQVVSRPTQDVRDGEMEELPVFGLAASGDTLCAGTERGLFRATAGETPVWRQVPGVPTTEQVLRVFAIPHQPDEILAFTQPEEQETVYRVYRSSNGCGSFDPVSRLQDVPGLPFDAASAFGYYWVTIGDQLYRGETLDQLNPAEFQPDGAGRYRGVFYHAAGNRLYVADEYGYIYYSGADGESWTSARIEPPAEDVDSVPLTLFTEIDGTILIGTKGYGFYQFADGAPDRARRGPRITSQLYEAHITSFAQFDSGKLVFATAAVGGLSSIDVDEADGNFGTWNWE